MRIDIQVASDTYLRHPAWDYIRDPMPRHSRHGAFSGGRVWHYCGQWRALAELGSERYTCRCEDGSVTSLTGAIAL